MKILLFSDSHGYTHNMVKAINKIKDIDMIIHLGDCIKDVIKIFDIFKDYKYEFVPGNNDWNREYQHEKMLILENKRIFITHGHLYNVKYDYKKIASRGKELGADAVFFGHTHKAVEIYSEELIIINPGSISLPIPPDLPSYCIVELNNDEISTRFESIIY